MGDRTVKGGDPTAAINFYVRAARLRPKDSSIRVKLGYALLDIGRYADAESVFRAVLAMKRDDSEAMRGLGHSQMARDRVGKALDSYRSAVAASKAGDYRAHNALGVALDMTGKHKSAQQAYRAGLRTQPGSLTLRNNLGLSLAITGKFRQSLALLRAVGADTRATPKHRQNLALVYGLMGRPDQAASVSRGDLAPGEVHSNLAFYEWLRKSHKQQLANAARENKRTKYRTRQNVKIRTQQLSKIQN